MIDVEVDANDCAGSDKYTWTWLLGDKATTMTTLAGLGAGGDLPAPVNARRRRPGTRALAASPAQNAQMFYRDLRAALARCGALAAAVDGRDFSASRQRSGRSRRHGCRRRQLERLIESAPGIASAHADLRVAPNVIGHLFRNAGRTGRPRAVISARRAPRCAAAGQVEAITAALPMLDGLHSHFALRTRRTPAPASTAPGERDRREARREPPGSSARDHRPGTPVLPSLTCMVEALISAADSGA